MQATLFVLATAFTAAMAAPSVSNRDVMKRTLGEASDSCGNGHQISCCNTNKAVDGDNNGDGGLLGGALKGLLGGNCSPLDVNVLGVQVPIQQACGDVAACCSGDQTGLINIQCNPISI